MQPTLSFSFEFFSTPVFTILVFSRLDDER